MKKNILIAGAGGHGKVLAYTILACSDAVAGFLDDNIPLGTEVIPGVRCLGKISEKISDARITHFIVGIGSDAKRKEVFAQLKENWSPAVLVHPSAVVFPSVQLGEGTVVLANATIMNGTEIGSNCIVNAGSLIDHDTKIASHTHIPQSCTIGSNCLIAEGAQIQIGSSIASGTRK